MRLGVISFIVVSCFAYNAYAQDDVVVDMSVLDRLNASYVAPHKPLFPVISKKDTQIPSKPKKKSPARQKETVAKVKAPVVSAKTEDLVKDKTSSIEVKSPAVSTKVEDIAQKAPLSAESVSPKAPQINPEENIIVVDVEPTVSDSNLKDENKQIDQNKTAQIASSNQDPIVNTDKTITPPPTVSEPNTTNETLDTLPSSQPKLLVEDDQQPVAKIDNSIKFAPGVDTLSQDQMSQINSIIGSFKDVEHNKIAIYSYNQDDGVDSFKKKRISLNRAIEVRSYLIKQGYKNFSIKVVNINSGSDKIDTVEIEEI